MGSIDEYLRKQERDRARESEKEIESYSKKYLDC